MGGYFSGGSTAAVLAGDGLVADGITLDVDTGNGLTLVVDEVVINTAITASYNVAGTFTSRQIFNVPNRFDAGAAITAAQYEVGRDADATNQMHLNVPTGASFEFSVNDVAGLVITASAVRPGSDDLLSIGVSGTAFSDVFLASGAVINFNAGDVTVTHSANTLAFAGATIYTMDAPVRWGTGVAITAGQYEIGRDADATNQLHFNIPLF